MTASSKREDEEEKDVFVNRPVAKETRVAYHPPPTPTNPVLRGLPLYYLANLVANSSFVSNILWNLNGFGSLRNLSELEGVQPRYLPDVIKSRSTPNPSASGGDSDYLSTTLGKPSDWPFAGPATPVLKSSWDYYEAYRDGRFTPLDVVEALLPLVRRHEGREVGKHAKAFVCVREELVREAARASTQRWKEGRPRSLVDGVVMAVKDEEDLAGHTRYVGSRIDHTSKDNATSFCVQKWLDAGAICLGKTTMHEFGMDTTNNNPIYGTPVNPNNETYYCGGSSGGSAYAVAAGLVPFAMGNDGGGSVRIPAAYTGLYSLKTSHARISMRPTANLARSTAVPGPMAANMLDLEFAYRIMAEPDSLNPDSAPWAPPTPLAASKANEGRRRKVLGIERNWLQRADPQVRRLTEKCIDHLTTKLGYSVVDISLPLLAEGQLAHAMTIMTEIASGTPPSTLSQLTPANKILLSVAAKTPGVDFLQAQKLRNLLVQHISHLFERYPGMVIVTPTTSNAGWPFKPADLTYGVSDGNMQIRNMEYVWLANFTGCPALSAPVGWVPPVSGEGDVPVGIMGLGEWGDEEGLMAWGRDVEGYIEGVGRKRPRGMVDVFGEVERR